MRNIIKFANTNNYTFTEETTFTGFKKVRLELADKIITLSERNSSRTNTINGWEGNSGKYRVTVSGERYTRYFKTQKECIEYIQECLK
ncbi:hypothetical protein KQUDLBSD_CDS0179 [Staphylococcus phage PG-2021_40]